MDPILKINGHDYGPLLVEGGISWKYSALDSEDSGRTTMDGVMHRAIIRYVWNGEAKLKPLTQEQLQMVISDMEAPFFTAEYLSPRFGHITGTFYTNNIQMTLNCVYKNGVQKWDGVSFPLIER